MPLKENGVIISELEIGKDFKNFVRKGDVFAIGTDQETSDVIAQKNEIELPLDDHGAFLNEGDIISIASGTAKDLDLSVPVQLSLIRHETSKLVTKLTGLEVVS
jgi:hypothetical protein